MFKIHSFKIVISNVHIHWLLGSRLFGTTLERRVR